MVIILRALRNVIKLLYNTIMYIALLGRQPSLSLAELERVFGSENVHSFSRSAASVNTEKFDIVRLGGTLKAGVVDFTSHSNDWSAISQQIISHYSKIFSKHEGKITLGISVYDMNVSPSQVQKVGLILKTLLKKQGVSLRLIPNQTSSLSSATSHHNKLGLAENKVEIIVVGKQGSTMVARSTGSQNITAYSKRDQARPKRDAFVGMLPPKLAQIMINMAAGKVALDKTKTSQMRLLDPFCGTGVILQEAALSGFQIYGTDLSDKMIDYTEENIKWLFQTHHIGTVTNIHQGDAMDTKWSQPIDIVASETYLGQPFSAPPSPEKLRQVIKNCEFIISSFLENISAQISRGTVLCIAVPAWKDKDGKFTHLAINKYYAKLNLQQIRLKTSGSDHLVYHREDQVVGRELLLLEKI